MTLASLFTLQFYGEATAASVTLAVGSAVADIKGLAKAQGTTTGTGSVPTAQPTRLVNRPATLIGTGSVTNALPKGRAKPSATIKVNVLSQDDVTGAVLEAEVSPGLTLRQALIDARKSAKLAAALSA